MKASLPHEMNAAAIYAETVLSNRGLLDTTPVGDTAVQVQELARAYITLLQSVHGVRQHDDLVGSLRSPLTRFEG